MLERILPVGVVVREARGDLDAPLHPREEAQVERAVEKRRREFATGRACAREALVELGRQRVPILSGPKGEPLWPQEVVGSITHCDGYRACALARSSELCSLGVDAEPDLPLPRGLLDRLALPGERELLHDLARRAPGTNWDRLLFSVKESLYKTWFPLTGSWLGFEDTKVSFDLATQSFCADLLVRGPVVGGRELRGVRGRWMAAEGLVITAIVVPA